MGSPQSTSRSGSAGRRSAADMGVGSERFFGTPERVPKVRKGILELDRERHGTFAINHCNFAYSALACFRMGMSGSASFQRAKKSW